jgi:hypothetical protein
MIDLRHAALIPAAFLLQACGSASPAPCTACLEVAGVYAETALTTTVDCGDNFHLRFTGGSGQTRITQSGSRLDSTGLGLTGVLHDDGSAIFGPIPAVAQPLDSQSGPTPGKLRLAGWFVDGAVPARFEGTYVFIADTNGCEIDAPTTLIR